MSSPPDVCGSNATSSSQRDRRFDDDLVREIGAVSLAAAGQEAASASRRAPGSSGSALESSINVTPLPIAISAAWPSSPNPVTSEQAWTGTGA